MALTVEDVSEEIRYRVGRLRQEMDLTSDLSTLDGKSYPPSILLAIAMLDAVRDEWDQYIKNWEWESVRDKAKELALRDHMPESIDVITSNAPGQAPCIVNTPSLISDEKLPVLAIQMNLCGMMPVWARYLNQARIEIEKESQSK